MRQSFWSTMRAVAVADDERRVAAGAVGDARLDVDGDGQPAEVELLAVDGADRFGEAERRASCGRARGSGSRAAARRCRAAGGRAATARPSGRRGGARRTGSRRPRCGPSRSSSSWSLRGNGNHEPKNAGHEPRVADDRAVVGLDEDPGVADRRGAHRRGRPTGAARRAGQATGGSVYCWPARDTCSVHAEPSQ